MQKYIILLTACLTVTVALPQHDRIVGGTLVGINAYPFSAAVLFASNHAVFTQDCGGSIINNRSILTAAHCVLGQITQYRIRVGSSNANSGGFVHNTAQRIMHPQYNPRTMNNDIAILRVTAAFQFGNTVRAASITGENSNIADDTLVWAIGWGWQTPGGFDPSEHLRHVQLRTLNFARCRNIHSAVLITESMMCAGWTEGGRGSCRSDSGSPLVLNNAVIGVTSFTKACASPHYPTIYTRVARFTNWIRSNA